MAQPGPANADDDPVGDEEPSPAPVPTVDAAERASRTRWTDNWVFREVFLALAVALALFGVQSYFEGQRELREVVRDDLRFVRETVVQTAGVENPVKPFSGLQLGDQLLIGLDLSGADLDNTNLENADLANANLEGADLEGADLVNANLEGAVANESTTWPQEWDRERAEAGGVLFG